MRFRAGDLCCAVGLVIWLAGCSSAVRIDLSGPNYQPMEQFDGGLAIRVSERVAEWEDSMIFSGTEVRFQTGRFYRDHFVLTEGEPARLELIESTLGRDETVFQGPEGQIGIRTTATYSATVAVTIVGDRHLLTATATSEPKRNFNDAAREAIRAVLDEFAREAAAIYTREFPVRTVRADGAIGPDPNR